MTHPKKRDTDGDGMRYGWEVENGLDPLEDDALLDSDGTVHTINLFFLAKTSEVLSSLVIKMIIRVDTYNPAMCELYSGRKAFDGKQIKHLSRKPTAMFSSTVSQMEGHLDDDQAIPSYYSGAGIVP